MQISEIEIREAILSDRPFIIDAMVDSLSPFYGGDHEAHAVRIFETHMAGGQDKIGFFSTEQKMFIATVDKKPAGMIHLVGKRQETYKISPLIVFKEYRGKYKLGQALMNHGERYARSHGARQLYCTIADRNIPAYEFFKRNNFIIAGTSESHYKQDVTEIMMYKNFIYENFMDAFDGMHISVLAYEEKYAQRVEDLLLKELPKDFKGIDKQWVTNLYNAYNRRNSNDVNQKYKLIFVAIDQADNVIGVAAGTPKKGEPIKLMPMVSISAPAFFALIRDVPYLLKGYGKKLYTHIIPSIEQTIILQLSGWKLDSVLPGAYSDDKITQQWSLNIDNIMHHLRVKKVFLQEIQNGNKTLEIRVRYPHLRSLRKGSRIYLYSHTEKQLVSLNDIREYSTFEELLKKEDYRKIVPNAKNEQEVLTLLREIYPPEKEALGPLVLDLELVKH